ncbi:hypothetical protein OJ252_3069 [Cryptosporidium canis]|uniref:Uncharacterized protein n=1 Tax=Cryptosporidium canis TaxID=195482 RepID=A0ABQ8P3G4_9CRYT|nr:hypothetical protein OJ252_3069 [Cryptosporidium canis]
MRGRCIRKVFTILSQDGIEFKLAISAISPDFGEAGESLSEQLARKDGEEHDESNYILKVVMTSFNPIELTTELGGPWEGYFLWDAIRGRAVGTNDGVCHNLSLMSFIQMMEDHASSESLFSMSLVNLIDYMDKCPSPSSGSRVFRDSEHEKDYLLTIKFEGVDSEMMLHLRSTSSSSYRDSSSVENINIIKCLKDMVELIKSENLHLQENLRHFTELSNNQKAASNAKHEESQFGLDNIKEIHVPENTNNSPNTCGTLELSELRIPSYSNNSQGSNSKLLSYQNSPISSRRRIVDADHTEVSGHVTANSRLASSEIMQNQIKAYRFIGDSSGYTGYNGSFSTSSLPAYSYSSSSKGKNSALRSAIESVRRTRNDLITRQVSGYSNIFDFNSDPDDNPRSNDKANCYEFEPDYLSKCFQKLNKNRRRQTNSEMPSKDSHYISGWSKNRLELIQEEGPRKSTPLYTREQLMNKLSNTIDISERINILKNMIKKTKEEPYILDGFD